MDKDIRGYEGRYCINEFGEVFSKDREIIDVLGRKKIIKRKKLKAQLNDNGYSVISLYKNKKNYRHFIHNLVAETFIGDKPQGKQTNHIDENKLNNHYSNLEYLTPKENINYGTGNRRGAESTKKPVVMINKFTGKGKFYKSGKDAELISNGYFKAKSISSVCRGQRISHKGYYWEFV